MELKAEDVKNIRSLALCKDILRQAIEKLKLEREFGLKRARGADHTIGHLCHDLCTQSAELRRQKYKRCLAIAEWCKESLRLMRTYEVTDSYWNLEPAHDAKYFCKKGDFFSKWRKRWLKLAEKFKEAK